MGMDNLMDKLCSAALEKADGFNCQEIANTMWSLAKLKEQRSDLMDNLMDKLCSAALEKADGFNCQDIANTMWSSAKLMVHRSDLMDKLCSVALEKFKIEGRTLFSRSSTSLCA